MNYTPEQEKCVTSLIGPLDVSAGAGSGKTFTLTQRIAHALSDPTSGVDDIDQVMAITFTRKAAAELKGRVRSVLRAQGMLEQARKVDGAWISTIHGMCSRILRTSALELGIDPAFSVLEDSREVLAQAIDEVLEECKQRSEAGEYAEYAALVKAFPPRSAGAFGTSLSDLLETVLNTVHGLPGGFNDLRLIQAGESASDLARQLCENYEESLALLETVKSSNTREANILAAQDGIAALTEYLQRGAGSVDALLEVLPECKRLSAACGTADQKAALKALNGRHTQLVHSAALLQADGLLSQLLSLAQRVEQAFSRKKRALSVLDNNDLIKTALKALDNPVVANLYSDKFRLVMIDEFQDTDALQLAIIKRLTGSGQRYLCTVGDAQQSIYGFRGADVALYRAYQQHLFDDEIIQAGGQPQELLLTRNFRSHGDVLAFVKTVCSQQRVFGEHFLDLQAVYDGKGYKGDGPRVRVQVTAVPDGKASDVGSMGDTIPEQAQRIVEFFSEMRDAGHSLSDMVLLLGVTTHAHDYASYLRAAGFECVISGGSLFASSEEAQMSVALARALANPKDTEALFAVLAGPLFRLSADELLQLASSFDEEADCVVVRSLDRGVRAVVAAARRDEQAVAQALPSALWAAQVLRQAWKSVSAAPLSTVMRYVLRESGCFTRLEMEGAQGTACLANYLKALRLVEKIEREGVRGVAQVSRAFVNLVQGGLKEAPGALNAANEQAIRIMSIHASKGLEFPVVALADFAKTPRPSKLLVQRVEGETFITLFPVIDKIANVNCGASAIAEDLTDDRDVTRIAIESASGAEARALLQKASNEDAAAEEQRLFYVGATRAKEAMSLFICMKESAKDPASGYKGVYGDITHALFSDGVIPAGESEVDYGGSAPAAVCKRMLELRETPPDECGAPETDNASLRLRYELQPWLPLPLSLPSKQERGLVSYSSLAGEASVDAALQGLLEMGFDDEGEPGGGSAPSARRMSDADKATDFGLALHRLCQLDMLHGAEVAQARLPFVAATYGLSQQERLAAAFDRWVASQARERAMGFGFRLPEQAFSVSLGATGLALEGAFDLLCLDEPSGGQRVLVIDYKTGGSAEETPAQLQTKHGLQACCYAYALLSQGYKQVELLFVRVEQDDPAGEDSLQEVAYTFDVNQLLELESLIEQCLSSGERS